MISVVFVEGFLFYMVGFLVVSSNKGLGKRFILIVYERLVIFFRGGGLVECRENVFL